MKIGIIFNGNLVKNINMTTGFDTICLYPGHIVSVKIEEGTLMSVSGTERIRKLSEGCFIRLTMRSAVAELHMFEKGKAGLLGFEDSFIQGPVVRDVIALRDYIYREFVGERTIEIYPDGSLEKVFQAVGETVKVTAIRSIELVNGVLSALLPDQAR
ncbi:MAG: hypothetical protein HGA38_01015 [Candidatus Moranbacteria bacterium]|nr:hypothetical protein [Candidatus Moranbacteria bacterium]NTW45593.1 hypothetical protein [Candidatus Moranbacteria bacterium]